MQLIKSKFEYICLSENNSKAYTKDYEYYKFINDNFKSIGLNIVSSVYKSITINGKVKDLYLHAPKMVFCDLSRVETFKLKLSKINNKFDLLNTDSIVSLTIRAELMSEEIYMWLDKNLNLVKFPSVKRMILICEGGNFVHDIFTMIKDFKLDYLKVKGISNYSINVSPEVKKLQLVKFDDLVDISTLQAEKLILDNRFRRININTSAKIGEIEIKNNNYKNIKLVMSKFDNVVLNNVH
jgi:hypothetical protein